MIKLIIVEDEDIIRRGLVMTMNWQQMGAEVIGSAADGEEGFLLAKEKQPDVVLTDIRMPRLSGLELAEKLHSEGYSAKIIFLTSYADFSYAQQAVRLGAADYLLKPVDEQELAAAIRRVSSDKKGSRCTSALADTGLIDWQSRLVDEDVLNPYVREVLHIIEKQYAERLSIEDMAEQQGVSASYLSRKLKEETGHTFGSLLTRFRLQQSLVLLCEGRRRVYEIAEMTGFGDYKNYAQVFKKYLHTSPTLFLQQFKSKM